MKQQAHVPHVHAPGPLASCDADKTSEQERSWQSKYRTLVTEVDTQERYLLSLQALLQQATTQLSLLVTGADTRLDTELLAWCEAAGNPVGFDEVEDHLRRLPTVTWAPDPEVGTMGDRAGVVAGSLNSHGTQDRRPADTVQLVLRWLAPMLRALAELEGLAEVVTPIVEKLESGANLEELSAMLDAANTRIVEDVKRMAEERAELEGLLVQVETRLSDFQDFAKFTRADLDESASSQGKLEQGVNARVQTLKGEVAESKDIEALKLRIHVCLDGVGAQFSQFEERENTRRAASTLRAKALEARVCELENETTTLRDSCRQREEQLDRDPLTNVLNRRAYERSIAKLVNAGNRDGTPFCLAICDLDRFKLINDNYGHLAGDRALAGFAKIAAAHVRDGDLFARIGGEEFAVLLPRIKIEEAQSRLEVVRQAVKNTNFRARGNALELTVSTGLSSFQVGDSVYDIYERADRALYEAKQGGRNRCIAA